MKEEEKQRLSNELSDIYNYFINLIKKTISLENKNFTIRIVFEVYILGKITSILTDKFILFLIVNVIIFYAPLEKNIPHFMFKWTMYFRQLVEGVLGLADCLIPKYEEKKEEEGKK